MTNADPRNGNTDITVRSLAIEVGAGQFVGDNPGILRFENVRNLELKDLTLRVRSKFYGIDLASQCRDALIEGCSIVNEGEGGCIMVRNRDASPERPTRNVRILRNRLGSGKVDEPLAVFGWLGMVQDVEVRGEPGGGDRGFFRDIRLWDRYPGSHRIPCESEDRGERDSRGKDRGDRCQGRRTGGGRRQ